MSKSTKNINWPLIIIVATVFVSATRWIPALMRSEGFEIPEMWLTWWVPVSAILAVGQPIVEAVSIAFALNAYRYMKNDSQKNLMMVLIGGTLVSFVGVLTPNIVASGSSRSVYELLGDWMWFWGISVVLSTVMPVAAVAFGAARMSETAQKATPQKKEPDKNIWDDVTRTPELPVDAFKPFAEETGADDWWDRDTGQENIKSAEPPRPDLVETKLEDAKVYTAEPDTRIVVNGYPDFKERMSKLNGNAPSTGAQVERMFKVARKTAYSYIDKYKAEAQK